MTGIVDYGLGNLHSVNNALIYIGEESVISSDKDVLSKCDRLILPGVGAFPDAMKRLYELDFVDFLRDYSKSRPLLGICLGMQLLFDKSYEGGENEGLGLISGEVIKLRAYESSRDFKIPHMGWNSLDIRENQPLYRKIDQGKCVYFVHSFKCVPTDESDIAATTDYGEKICASVHRGNVYGCQFHPEKSGQDVGLKILKNFVSL